MIKLQVRTWLLRLVPIAAIVAASSLLIVEAGPLDTTEVNFNNRLQIPQLNGVSVGGTQNTSLRVAISGVITPTRTLHLIRGGQVDIAFVCSLAYLEGRDVSSMELLVAPVVNGRTEYYSYLIVPYDRPNTSLENLRQKVFAFTDPISNSGHLAPTYQLALLGETPGGFFRRYIYTYSHDNSIVAVADKLVDGAAVDSLVYDQLAITNPELISKTKIIARWGPYGIPPVVVNPELDPKLKEQLRIFLLNLHNSDTGVRLLRGIGIEKFVIVEDDLYSSVREMKNKLGW